MAEDSENGDQNPEIEESQYVGMTHEDAEAFKMVIEDLKRNMEEFRRKTESVPVSAKGSFRTKQAVRVQDRPTEEQESKINALRKRLEDTESKNEKLRKKNGELGSDLAKMKARLNNLMEEVEYLTKENDALRRRNKELLDMPKSSEEVLEKCARLEAENESAQEELEGLRAEKTAVESDLERLRKESAEAAALIEARISEQDEIIRKLKAGIPLSEMAGTVERISATEFESSLFDGSRYDVRMARNGSYVTFKQDVEGKVACSDGVLTIPTLQDLVEFSGPRKYDAYHFNGGLKVVLR